MSVDEVLPQVSDKRMTWLSLGLGVALLLFGRLLWYVFVIGAGFLAGRDLAHAMFRDERPNVVLIASVILGIIGGVLAIFAMKVALALAGFCAGGYLALAILQSFRIQQHAWFPFILGGLVGAVLSLMVVDWAYVVLSALVGASAISRVVIRQPMMQGLLFLALSVGGIVFQANMMK